MYRIILLTALVNGVVGLVSFNETCPANVTAVKPDLDQILGTWYQQYRIGNSEASACSFFDFTKKNNTVTIVKSDVINNTQVNKTGTVTTNTNSTKMVINFSDNNETYDYYILFASSNISVLYTCKDMSNTSSNVWAWMLSKEKNLKITNETTMETMLTELLNVKNATWVKVNQTNCDNSSNDKNGSSNLLASPAAIVIYFLIYVLKELF